MKYRNPETGEFKEIYVKAADTLPVGSVVDYEGEEVPAGWEEVEEPKIIESGSNDNGYYVKFSDGTLICKGRGHTEPNAASVDITFPKAFGKSADVEIVTTNKFTHNVKIIWSAIAQNAYYFKAWPIDVSTGATPTTKGDFGYIAFGKWKD